MKAFGKLAVVIVALASVSVAQADPITYVFTGNFGTAEQGCWMRSGPDICDQELFGYFTIDDEPVAADETSATYFGAGGPYGMYLAVGDQVGWNSEVSLTLYSEGNQTIFSNSDFVLFHTGTLATSGTGTDEDATLTFASWWLASGGSAFDGPPRFPPMPDPSDFSNGTFDNVCALALEGCYITVGESEVNPRTIFDWTFFRSPVVIPIPVPEPGSLALLGLGLVGMAAARRRKKA